jgi:hypothetical protein
VLLGGRGGDHTRDYTTQVSKRNNWNNTLIDFPWDIGFNLFCRDRVFY